MVTNPNKKRSRVSFLLGVVVTLLICGVVIYFLFMQLTEMKKEKENEEASKKEVYILKNDIKAGDTINSADLMMVQVVLPTAARRDGSTVVLTPEVVVPTAAPANAVTSAVSGQIAKIDVKKGTVLTTDMIIEEQISNDLRMQEYNMIELPIKLEIGDFVDLRLTLPNSQDYLVVAKKRVEDVSENTIWMKMTEEEIVILNSAMVEAYVMKGSVLYATTYVDFAIQDKATITYPVSKAIIDVMNADPNITAAARDELSRRMNDANYTGNRQTINGVINSFNDSAQKSIEEKVKEHIQKQQEERKNYLEGLTTTTTTTTKK